MPAFFYGAPPQTPLKNFQKKLLRISKLSQINNIPILIISRGELNFNIFYKVLVIFLWFLNQTRNTIADKLCVNAPIKMYKPSVSSAILIESFWRCGTFFLKKVPQNAYPLTRPTSVITSANWSGVRDWAPSQSAALGLLWTSIIRP